MQVDPADWRLEVERVAPRLKITLASNARDWRSHLDDAHKHSSEINTVWPDAQAALGAVQAEVRLMCFYNRHSLIDRISDTRSQGCIDMQSLVEYMDHRDIVSVTVCSQARS